MAHNAPFFPQEVLLVPELRVEPLQQPEHVPQSCLQLHFVSLPLHNPSPHSGIEITHCLFWQILPLLEQLVHAAPLFPQ